VRRKKTYRFPLTFLLYPYEDDPRKFVAHCLQLDVVALGQTKPKAISLLKELITELLVAADEEGTLDKVITPAPAKYWGMLAHAVPYNPPERIKAQRIQAPPVRRVDYAIAS
jgi:hypothetical protein